MTGLRIREILALRWKRVNFIGETLVVAETCLVSNNLRKRGLQSACKRAGLPRINWHALRHTHGTLLHVQGTPLKVAQAQLGHSHMATTLEIYTHASVIAQREAVNLVDEQVFPKTQRAIEVRQRALPQLIDISRLNGAPKETILELFSTTLWRPCHVLTSLRTQRVAC